MISFARSFAVVLSFAIVASACAGQDSPTKNDADNKPVAEQKAKKKKRTKKRDAKKEVLPAPKESAADNKPGEQKLDGQKTENQKPATDAKPSSDQATSEKSEQKKSEDTKPDEKKADKSKFAAINESKAGEDFQYQGEYMGKVTPDTLASARAGLQVIALGDGTFEANLLRGGLPGAGWDRRMKEKLAGKLENGQLLLKNEHWLVRVEPHRATLQRPDGATWGVIPKYHRISATQDASPWAGATVLFDGTNTSQFQKGKVTEDGLLSIGALTKEPVRDFHLHLEFRTPFMPYARGQGRGNSGVYIQERYEVQILDSFGLEGVNNECGGLYKQQAPSLNMCLPPLSWQTYDITFQAARFDAAGKKVADARITVLHNGEPIHWHYAIKDKTGGGKAEGPDARPILLQDHGNPVAFRNVWITTYSGNVVTPQTEFHLGAEG